MSASGAPAASGATLIANFYGQGRPGTLTDGLIRSFALTSRAHGSYADQDGKTLMRSFDPPADSAYGIGVTQLVLNADGPVEAAWRVMRRQLEDAVDDAGGLEGVLGYSLIYQAELVPGGAAEDAFATLGPVPRRLRPEPPDPPPGAQAQACAEVPGGRLWLMSIPLRGDGLQAATVYLALSDPGATERLVREVLYNRVAPLLMVDLIAHKGYYQIRQYRLGNLDQEYLGQLGKLQDRTNAVLGSLSQAAVPDGELGQLAHEYRLLVRAVMRLDDMRLGLSGELANLGGWRQRPGDDIVEFHYGHLDSGSRELELLVARGQRPLETAKTAVDMVQARLDKQQGDYHGRVEVILSAAATALSVLVLVDRGTAQAILQLLGVRGPIGIWPELAVQIACVAIFSVLAVFAVRLIARSKRADRHS